MDKIELINKFKDYIEMDLDDTTKDSIISMVVDGAISVVEDYINKYVVDTTEDVTIYVHNRDNTIVLPKGNVTSINSVTVDDNIINTTDVKLINDKLIFNNLLSIDSVVVVNISGGGDINGSLLIAILKLADKLYTDALNNNDTTNNYTSEYGMKENIRHVDFPDNVKMILQQNKRIVVL